MGENQWTHDGRKLTGLADCSTTQPNDIIPEYDSNTKTVKYDRPRYYESYSAVLTSCRYTLLPLPLRDPRLEFAEASRDTLD